MYLDNIKNEANITNTENGAVTYKSSMSDCLDLFATIGALRRESDEEIITRFVRAYAEDADSAMKILFLCKGCSRRIGRKTHIPCDFQMACGKRTEISKKKSGVCG